MLLASTLVFVAMDASRQPVPPDLKVLIAILLAPIPGFMLGIRIWDVLIPPQSEKQPPPL
ncbi:MAG: hypothetical protein HYZ63_00680 [Candidatus Andersenbacteria bacterium]|nr:hypothetical protein [Candidatus Andersenbacteria bacterium]